MPGENQRCADGDEENYYEDGGDYPQQLHFVPVRCLSLNNRQKPFAGSGYRPFIAFQIIGKRQ